MKKYKLKVCLVKSSFAQHFPQHSGLRPLPMTPFLFVIERNESFFKPK